MGSRFCLCLGGGSGFWRYCLAYTCMPITLYLCLFLVSSHLFEGMGKDYHPNMSLVHTYYCTLLSVNVIVLGSLFLILYPRPCGYGLA